MTSDIYGSLSGESPAPKRPPGFYIGQYNKAGPWGNDRRPYGIYIPPHLHDRPGPFPLIVYLHGYGERSPRQLFAAGLPLSIATRFGEGSQNGPFDFIALFLNDPTGNWEPNSPEGRDAIEVLDFVTGRHKIDSSRVYLTGLSSGGNGVWHFAQAYPNRWAALATIGARSGPDPSSINSTPVWMFHGERDEVVPISSQREVFKQLKEAGCDVRFSELPGKPHTVSAEVYDKVDLFIWLASKAR